MHSAARSSVGSGATRTSARPSSAPSRPDVPGSGGQDTTCLLHQTMTFSRRLSVATCVGIVVSALAVRPGAQPPGITAHGDPPPVELEDPIEAILAPGGQHVTIGGKMLDFWWVKSLPLLVGTADVSWAAVEEGTVVGAVKLSASYPDVRGRTIPAGLCTLRY